MGSAAWTEPGRPHSTFNDTDGIFDPALILTLSQPDDGYLGLITLGVGTA